MVTFPLPSGTFPPLELSSEDKRLLEHAAEVVVKNAIGQCHEHLTVHKGVVDETRWKKIRHREDVRVYRERMSSFGAHESASNSSESSAKDGAAENTLDGRTVASMLTVGSIPGKLDDVMYGVLSPTLEEMRLKTAYVEDGLEDWSLLASIIKPSEAGPFRELSLKWTAKCHPMPLSAVLRVRDAVYIESSGFANTPNGERIGYHLYHSVEVPGIRELDGFKIVRIHLSVCEFFRQRKENCVEVYARSVMNPMGDVPAIIVSMSASEVAIAVFQYVRCAEMKKLTRMLRSKLRHQQLQNGSSLASSTGSWSSPLESISLSSPGTCEICGEKTSSVAGFSFSNGKEKQCRICSARVCARCRVEKTVHVSTEDKKQLESERITFCTRCVLSASSASSSQFAVLDAIESDGKMVDYKELLP